MTKLTPEGEAAAREYYRQGSPSRFNADWNAIAKAAIEASDEVKMLRKHLQYVTTCPECGAEPGCNIDCDVCLEWPV